MSLNALFFGVFIDAVCSSILGPNYPFMVNRAVDPATGVETDEPAHDEGFDDLGGLGVTTVS